ncbi:hypothetical protein BDZ89DRAFT_1067399 [Hymenopellis radicata]|nr:hypothetical protein BDZ89DRAFT_1067399 [Hymenopellis radicata]
MDLGLFLLRPDNSPHVTPNDELDVHCRPSQYNTATHPNTRRPEIKIASPSNSLRRWWRSVARRRAKSS